VILFWFDCETNVNHVWNHSWSRPVLGNAG